MSQQLTWARVPRRGFVVAHWECEPARFSIWQVRTIGSAGLLRYELVPGYTKFVSLAEAKAEAQRRHDSYLKEQNNG